MALSLSKKLGATCILSDVDDSRLEGARGWDADVTLNALHGDFHDCMMALTGGEGPNVILDIGDSAQRMAENVQLISQAGRIVCGNDGSGEACYSMPVLSRKEAVITGPRMRQGHLSAVIEHFHADLDTLRPIAFLHFPFDLAEQAFALAGTAPNAAKVVVDFD